MTSRTFLLALAVAALLPAATARADVPIGVLGASSINNSCVGDDFTVVGNSAAFRAPSDGVVTQMRTAHAMPGAAFAFRMFRDDGTKLRGIARVAATVALDGTALVQTRIPVHAGDRLGVSKSGFKALNCVQPGPKLETTLVSLTDQADGIAFSVVQGSSGQQVNAAARMQADRDGDGFGDETQDGCPDDASTHGACPVPEQPAPATQPAPPAPPLPPAPAPEATPGPAPGPAPADAPVVVAAAANPAPAAARLCRVPRLKRLTLRAAKARLLAAGCAPGKVRRGKGKRLRVRRQSVPAGIEVRLGTRIRLVAAR
jgi:hypothetical protein